MGEKGAWKSRGRKSVSLNMTQNIHYQRALLLPFPLEKGSAGPWPGSLEQSTPNLPNPHHIFHRTGPGAEKVGGPCIRALIYQRSWKTPSDFREGSINQISYGGPWGKLMIFLPQEVGARRGDWMCSWVWLNWSQITFTYYIILNSTTVDPPPPKKKVTW